MKKSKPRVLLISVRNFHANEWEKYRFYIAPLGIGFISAYAKNEGFECQMLDMHLFKGWGDFMGYIRKFKPDVVGLSVMTSEADIALKVSKKVKKFNPKIKIIAGGPHATILPRDLIKHKEIDIEVVGEGEVTFSEILNYFYNGGSLENIKGIAYKQGNKILLTPRRERIENLDELPFVDRDIYDSEGWQSKCHTYFFPMKYPLTTIMASRGCPGKCRMCQPTLDSIFGCQMRIRSPENVIKEIKELKIKYKIKGLIFWDDTLTVNRKWLEMFCGLMEKEKLGIDWWCYSRVNNINDEILEKMKRAGCTMICFGLESGSQRVLNDVIRKGATVAQNEEAIILCRKHGILSDASVMVGSPSETVEEVKMTDAMLTKVNPDVVAANVTSPMPGTYLGDEAIKRGIVTTKKWSEFFRSQNGNVKFKIDIDAKTIMWYQSKWHKARFRPTMLKYGYYIKACEKLAINHLEEGHPLWIFTDFIAGPFLEITRKLYWRNLDWLRENERYLGPLKKYLYGRP